MKSRIKVGQMLAYNKINNIKSLVKLQLGQILACKKNKNIKSLVKSLIKL